MSESADKLIERLIDLLMEPIEANPELLKAALAEEGIDYEKLADEGELFVRSLISKQKLMCAKQERESVVAEIKALVTKLAHSGKDEAVKAFNALFPSYEQEPALQGFFHKLTSASTKEDIDEILQDVEILKLLKEKRAAGDDPKK